MPTILHLSFSLSGGAGLVMSRIAEVQRRHGWNSFCYSKISNSLRSHPQQAPLDTVLAGIDEIALKNLHFPGPISLMRDSRQSRIGSLGESPDLIHLHWINGLTSVTQIRRQFPGVPIVWTLHDMNPFTGACHQSIGCRKFETSCSGCPATTTFAQPLVTRRLVEKIRDYQDQSFSLVAPSQWLAQLSRKSEVFKGREIRVIPNPISDALTEPPRTFPSPHGLVKKVTVIAQNLRDPIKDVSMLVRVHQADPELRQKLHLNLVGDNGQAFVGLPNVSVHGPLTQEAIAEVLEKSDYVVSTSKSESFGLSIIEGASRGAIPIVPAGSAMAELVQILESGFEFEDEHMLINIFQGVLHSSRPTKSQRQRLSQRAIEYFGPEMAFTRYADVYSEWGVK